MRGSGPLDASSDRARIAQATGMLMELFGLGARQALALLHVMSWMKLLSTSSAARELVERWPQTA
jgi:AmiR/NasT family two-component response regulator